MTKLGEEILKTLQEQASKSMQSSTAAGLAASKAKSSVALRNKLERYFKNIIPLQAMDPMDHPEFPYLESLTTPPSEKSLAKYYRRGEDTRGVRTQNRFDPSQTKIVPVIFKSQSKDEINRFEATYQTPPGKEPIKREALPTKAAWERKQDEALDDYSYQTIHEGKQARKKFDTFISNCMKAENLPQLVKLIETIEKISRDNTAHLSLIGDLLASRNLTEQQGASVDEFGDIPRPRYDSEQPVPGNMYFKNSDLEDDNEQIQSLDDSLIDYRNSAQGLNLTRTAALLTVLKKIGVPEDEKDVILKICSDIIHNPNDLKTATVLADIVNTVIIPYYDEDDYNDHQNRAIKKSLAPFQEINPIHELLKINLAREAKNESSLIREFFDLKGRDRFEDPSLEYLATRTLDKAQNSNKKNSPNKPG